MEVSFGALELALDAGAEEKTELVLRLLYRLERDWERLELDVVDWEAEAVLRHFEALKDSKQGSVCKIGFRGVPGPLGRFLDSGSALFTAGSGSCFLPVTSSDERLL